MALRTDMAPLPPDLEARLNAERVRGTGTGEKTTPPAEGEVGAEMQIARDLGEVAILRARQDPRWEALFDSVEERLDDVASPHLQSYAFRAYLRMGLTRPAYRHWLRAQKPSSVELVAAVWREELLSSYRIVVASMCAEEGDWCAVSGNVELATAQHNAGDLEGAQHTAAAARRIAEEGATEVLTPPAFIDAQTGQLAAGDAPARAIWYLSSLIPLEVALGDEDAARAVLARCQQLLDAPSPEGVSKKNRAQARATALDSLPKDCARAGFHDASIDFLRLGKDNAIVGREVVRLSGSVDVARRVFADLTDPEERVALALLVCRETLLPHRRHFV